MESETDLASLKSIMEKGLRGRQGRRRRRRVVGGEGHVWRGWVRGRIAFTLVRQDRVGSCVPDEEGACLRGGRLYEMVL